MSGQTKQNLISAWIYKAEQDLKTVEHELSFNDPVFESICFHCQQAAEKYIKAYLIFLEINFVKTHEIGELITLCETKDKEIGSIKEKSDILTDYAVEIRYPDDIYIPSSEEAEEAYRIACEIKSYVLSKIFQT